MKHFINKTKVTHKLVQKNMTDFTIFIGTDKECLEYRKFNYIIQENFIILPLSEEKNTHKIFNETMKNIVFVGSEKECCEYTLQNTDKNQKIMLLDETPISLKQVVKHIDYGCDIIWFGSEKEYFQSKQYLKEEEESNPDLKFWNEPVGIISNTHKVISRKEKNLTFYIGSERECFQFMFDTERTLKDHIVIELKESEINHINVVSVTREHVENIRKILGCDINQLETYTDAVKDIFVIVVDFDFYKKRILKLNNDKTLIFEMKNYFNKNMKPNTARMFAQVIIINYKQL